MQNNNISSLPKSIRGLYMLSHSRRPSADSSIFIIRVEGWKDRGPANYPAPAIGVRSHQRGDTKRLFTYPHTAAPMPK